MMAAPPCSPKTHAEKRPGVTWCGLAWVRVLGIIVQAFNTAPRDEVPTCRRCAVAWRARRLR